MSFETYLDEHATPNFPPKLLLNEIDSSVIAGRLSAPGAPPKSQKEKKQHIVLINKQQQRERRLIEKQANELKKKRLETRDQIKEWMAKLRPFIGEYRYSVLQEEYDRYCSHEMSPVNGSHTTTLSPQTQSQSSRQLPDVVVHQITLDDTEQFNKLIRGSKKMCRLWTKGLPPCVTAHVWKYAIGNPSEITTGMYMLCKSKVAKRQSITGHKNCEAMRTGCGSLADCGTDHHGNSRPLHMDSFGTDGCCSSHYSLQKENEVFHRLFGTGVFMYGSNELLYGNCVAGTYDRHQELGENRFNTPMRGMCRYDQQEAATGGNVSSQLIDRNIIDRAIAVDLPRTVIIHNGDARSPLPYTTIGTSPRQTLYSSVDSSRHCVETPAERPAATTYVCVSKTPSNSGPSHNIHISQCSLMQRSPLTDTVPKSMGRCIDEDISVAIRNDSHTEVNDITTEYDQSVVASCNSWPRHQQRLSKLKDSYEDSLHQYSNEELMNKSEQGSSQTTSHDHTLTHNICDDIHLQTRVSELLKVFVELRPDIGYVQGMSYLAAMILIHIDNDEEAFVCLANLVNIGHFRHFYTFNHVGIWDHISVYEDVLKRGLPALHNHFKVIGVTPQMYVINWWITLFSHTLSYEIATRCWSLFLLDNSYLYRISICLLYYFSHIIHENCPVDEVLMFFSKMARYTIDEKRLFAIINDSYNYPPSIYDIKIIMNRHLGSLM